MNEQTSPTVAGVPPAFFNRFGDSITGVLSGFDRLRLRGTLRHLYHYFLHEELGLCHIRVQTWFPFTVDLCLNGRDRLARQMDQAGLAYRQRDNCFVWVEDADRAQALLAEQLRTDWPRVLGGLLDQAHPLHAEICRPIAQTYYWSASASEYATDLLFRDAASLAALYPRLVHHGLRTFASPDVMRFLGHKISTTHGRVRGNFRGEVISDLKHRPEGIRVKHSVNGNSVKMYDKEGSVLRIETTINRTEDFRGYHAKQGEPDGEKTWRPLQRSVGELWRRAEVSAAANHRYLQALASVTEKMPVGEATAGVCRAVVKEGRRHRALNPWSEPDAALLAAVSRGEYVINGLRNRDLRRQLWPKAGSPQLEHRRAASVTRQLRLLRAHGLLRKVSGTHRYVVTASGRKIITALLAARQADVEQLPGFAA